MAYEKNAYSLLQYMAKQDIPIEINLGSRVYTKRVKKSCHPISLYKRISMYRLL
jgi:hypothetical protein